MQEASHCKGIDAITALVLRYSELVKSVAPERGQVELEARLGHMRGGRFISGTSTDLFNTALTVVKGFDDVENMADVVVTEHHDTFFRYKGVRYRTRTQFDSENMKMSSKTIQKQRIEHVTFHMADLGVCLKVQVSIEWNAPHDIPFFVTQESMRIVQRHSRVVGHWTYDMALVWQGQTRQHAERLRFEEAPHYEVEVELSQPMEYMQSRSAEHVGRALLMRASDIVGSSGVSAWSVAK